MNHVPEPTADELIEQWHEALDETLDRGFVEPGNLPRLRALLLYLHTLLPKETPDDSEKL